MEGPFIVLNILLILVGVCMAIIFILNYINIKAIRADINTQLKRSTTLKDVMVAVLMKKEEENYSGIVTGLTSYLYNSVTSKINSQKTLSPSFTKEEISKIDEKISNSRDLCRYLHKELPSELNSFKSFITFYSRFSAQPITPRVTATPSHQPSADDDEG